ncbi:MAG: hypothetical protein SGJ16_07625 [Nitrospirota bacterium]|nr:hypothetical protein [Nitrospirota bacterium]
MPFRRLLIIGLFGCVFSFPVWADAPPLPSSVWQSVPDQAPAPRKPWVLRARAIALNPLLLQTLKDAAARPLPPVFIELFDDTRYELAVSSTVSRINDSAVIRGLLNNTPHGDFTFFINGSVMAATIHVGNRLFTIEHVSNGHHRLLELNHATVPPD